MRNIRLFKTEAEFNEAYNGDEYVKPWLSATLTGDSEYRINRNNKLRDPLTFKITSPGNIVWKAYNTAYTTTIEYKKNNGEWTSITSNTGASAPSISVVAGDKVQFRGSNATYSSGSSRYNYFSGTTCGFNVEGNIMSLINSTDFATATTLSSSYTFYRLFYYCTGLTDASNLILPATTLEGYCYQHMFAGCTALNNAPKLPATTLAGYCYARMFSGCTSLTTAPELPATTLANANSCYNYMFYGCTSLTTAPELPATTLANSCYLGMFDGCTSLTTAPTVLPATTLAEGCYMSMFSHCTSLVSVPTNYLTATTLTESCYNSMFNGCTSLTTAPELPAPTLAPSCYGAIFSSCSKLNHIKCLATDISASNCTYGWVEGVASTGTFVTPQSTSWTTGNNGIPTNWTRVNA